MIYSTVTSDGWVSECECGHIWQHGPHDTYAQALRATFGAHVPFNTHFRAFHTTDGRRCKARRLQRIRR